VLDQFPTYHTNILYFNAKEEGENVFKLTVGDENFDESINDNGIYVVSFAT
jgi:hypothetical protein